MAMPGQKMYVITKPELIQAVQKQHKVLAFPPIEAKFASKICGDSLWIIVNGYGSTAMLLEGSDGCH